VFESSVLFARHEGIVPAPEAGHAIAAVFEEARQAKEAGQERVILFNLSGHGYFDLAAYDAYFAGNLQDYEFPREAVVAAQQRLPQVGEIIFNMISARIAISYLRSVLY